MQFFIALGVAIAIFALIVGWVLVTTGSLLIAKVVGIILIFSAIAFILGVVIFQAQWGDSKGVVEDQNEDIGTTDADTTAKETRDPDDDVVDFSAYPSPASGSHH